MPCLLYLIRQDVGDGIWDGGSGCNVDGVGDGEGESRVRDDNYM